VVIHLFPKALALCVPGSLESDGRTATIRLTKKLRRCATKSHPYTVRNPDNGTVVVLVQSDPKAPVHRASSVLAQM